MVESVDIDTSMNILGKQAMEIALKVGFDTARQRVQQTAIDILRGVRASTSSMSSGGGYYGAGGPPGSNGGMDPSSIPSSLQLLPLYAMSLQKSLILRGGSEIPLDERAFYFQLFGGMNVSESRHFIYPRLFSLHDMSSEVGLPDELRDGEGVSDGDDGDSGSGSGSSTVGPLHLRLPSLLNLSHERLCSEGIYLLDNGLELLMWIGRGVNPAIIQTLFDVHSLDHVDLSTLSIKAENSDYSSRLSAILLALQCQRPRYQQLHFIREGDGYAEAYFSRFLVEDR